MHVQLMQKHKTERSIVSMKETANTTFRGFSIPQDLSLYLSLWLGRCLVIPMFLSTHYFHNNNFTAVVVCGGSADCYYCEYKADVFILYSSLFFPCCCTHPQNKSKYIVISSQLSACIRNTSYDLTSPTTSKKSNVSFFSMVALWLFTFKR